MTPIIILSLDHLAEVVEQHLQMYGPICDLNHLDISRWDVANLEYAYGVFTSFQDNLPGYLGVLQGEYGLPENFPQAALFHQVRALAEGLDLDPMGAARFIAREMHQPELVVNLPTSLDFSA